MLFKILQWTWGLPQNILGFIVYLYYAGIKHFPHGERYNCIVTYWGNRKYSMSLGMFVFLSTKEPHMITSGPEERMLSHECGHSVQSIICGPLWLLIFGVESMVWCLYGQKLLSRLLETNLPYHWFYTEKNANALGKWYTGLDGVNW